MCQSKKKGGLGIGRMLDKTVGMLAKWVWRFGYEASSLWKNVVCANYGIDERRMVWDWQSCKASSYFVKTIANLFKPGSRTAKVCEEGLQVVIGCGNKVRFWEDIIVESVQLKEAFPRIFPLAAVKEGFISDFGSW